MGGRTRGCAGVAITAALGTGIRQVVLLGAGLDAYRVSCAANGRPGPFGHDDPAALFAAAGWGIDHLTWAGAPDANYGRFIRVAAPAMRSRAHAHLVTGVRRAPIAG